LWLGSNGEGLQKISASGNKCYTTESGLPNNSVRALCEDKNGNIWVGTASGVVFITPDGKMMTPQFEAGTVSKGVIAISLFRDSGGRMWLISGAEKVSSYFPTVFSARDLSWINSEIIWSLQSVRICREISGWDFQPRDL
jgi:ligand-binding sensor domain-containing protein